MDYETLSFIQLCGIASMNLCTLSNLLPHFSRKNFHQHIIGSLPPVVCKGSECPIHHLDWRGQSLIRAIHHTGGLQGESGSVLAVEDWDKGAPWSLGHGI